MTLKKNANSNDKKEKVLELGKQIVSSGEMTQQLRSGTNILEALSSSVSGTKSYLYCNTLF